MSAALDHERISALRGIYRQHFRLVWWVVRSSGVPDDAVEDVVHDVFVAAHSRWPAGEEHEGGRWIAGVARSVAYSHRRAHARRLRRVEALPEPEPEIDAEERVAARQAWSQLAAFLDELDEGQREVFVLAELEGRSAPEISATLGVKLNTVYSRLRLARGRFDKAFAPRSDVAMQRARAHAGPESSAEQRTWAALAVSLGPGAGVGPAVSSAATGAAAKGAATTATALGINAKVAGVVLLGITVLGAVRLVVTPESPGATGSSDTPAEHAVAALASEQARESSRPPGASASLAELPGAQPRGEPVDVTPGLVPSPATNAEPPSESEPPPPPPPEPEPADDATPPAAKPKRPFAATELELELEGVQQARAHREQGEPEAALAELDALDQRVRHPALDPERPVLRVDVLCDLGRTTEARTLAAEFLRRHPKSRLAPKLRRGCDSP